MASHGDSFRAGRCISLAVAENPGTLWHTSVSHSESFSASFSSVMQSIPQPFSAHATGERCAEIDHFRDSFLWWSLT